MADPRTPPDSYPGHINPLKGFCLADSSPRHGHRQLRNGTYSMTIEDLSNISYRFVHPSRRSS